MTAPLKLEGLRLVEVIRAQRALKALVAQRRALGLPLDPAALTWADAPEGLGWPHDPERVLKVFFEAAGGRPGAPADPELVERLLDATLDHLVEANRSLIYDDVLDSVELAVASGLGRAPLAQALASLAHPTPPAMPPRAVPASLPSVRQVRFAERWVLEVLARLKGRGAGRATLHSLVTLMTQPPTREGDALSLEGWTHTLTLLDRLRDRGALTDGAHLVRRAAMWWAGLDTVHPFPDADGDGTANEAGGDQALYDAFAAVARAAPRR